MKESTLLKQAHKDAEAVKRDLDIAMRQLAKLPSFQGKAALMDRIISAWNRTSTLSVNIRDEQYDQKRGIL
jgi:hypothetical protein